MLQDQPTAEYRRRACKRVPRDSVRSRGKEECLRGSRTAMFVRLEHCVYKIYVGLVGRLVLRRARTSRHLRGHAANLVRQPDGFLVESEKPLEDCAGLHLRVTVIEDAKQRKIICI